MLTDHNFEFIIIIICTLIAAPISIRLNKRLQTAIPNVKPYNWGYFTGIMGLLVYGIISISLFVLAATDKAEFLIIGIISALLMIPFYYIIKRKRWAWIIAIVVQLNPLLWIIDGIYVKRRWMELSPDNNLQKHIAKNFYTYSKINNLSPLIRTILAISIFWPLVAIAYVILFEPYGTYMSNKDHIHFIKVILFPLAALCFGSLLFKKIIRPDPNTKS